MLLVFLSRAESGEELESRSRTFADLGSLARFLAAPEGWGWDRAEVAGQDEASPWRYGTDDLKGLAVRDPTRRLAGSYSLH